MATEEVEVAISPSGEVSIKVKGVFGSRCLSTTADLERALGGEVVDRQMSPEAYAQQAEQQPAWNRSSW